MTRAATTPTHTSKCALIRKLRAKIVLCRAWTACCFLSCVSAEALSSTTYGVLELDGVLSLAPTNPRDPLCVAAWVPGSPGESGSISAATSRLKILGHVAKEVARWLSPLLDSPLRVTRYVATMKIHAGCLFVYHQVININNHHDCTYAYKSM